MTRAAAVAALAEVIDSTAPAWRRWLRDVGLLEEAAKMADSAPRARSGAEEELGVIRRGRRRRQASAAAPRALAARLGRRRAVPLTSAPPDPRTEARTIT